MMKNVTKLIMTPMVFMSIIMMLVKKWKALILSLPTYLFLNNSDRQILDKNGYPKTLQLKMDYYSRINDL